MVESEVEKNRRFTKQVAEIAKNPKPPVYLDDATTQAARELADKLAYVNTHSHLVEIIIAALKRCRNEALEEAAELCDGYAFTEANGATLATFIRALAQGGEK